MDQYREEAAKVFHQPPESYNCAQSVAVLAGRVDLAPGLRPCGGGRVEGGFCGALYAAEQLVAEADRPALRKEFQVGAGALTCREIKGGQKTPCVDCVALGAKLVDQFRTATGKES